MSKDPRLCKDMTIDSLDDVHRFLSVHLLDRVTNEIDRANLEKSLPIILRASAALIVVRAAVEDAR